MSMQFDRPYNEEALAKIREAFGEPVARDDKTLIFDRMTVIKSSVMGDIARAAKQPVRVEMHGEGEVKTLADGTQYRATPQGWRKVEA